MIFLDENRVYADILSIQLIPNISKPLKDKFNLSASHHSIGLVTLTLDDVGITALDEATKEADVEVVYAHSFYGGSDYASGPLSGEFIGVISGPSSEEVKSGLKSIENSVESKYFFEKINRNPDHLFFAQTISSCGSFLAKEAKVEVGNSLAYLIAPPIEAMVGIDAALKAADVELCCLYSPPTETNFGGAILTGSQSSCEAAVSEFKDKVNLLAQKPIEY